MLELLDSSLLLPDLLLLGHHFDLSTVAVINGINVLFLVLGVFPERFLIFNAHLEVSIDVCFFYLGLPCVDEEAQFVVEFVNEVEYILKLWGIWLSGAQLEGLFVLNHRSLEVIQLGIDDPHDFIYLGYFAGVLSVLRLPRLQSLLQDLKSLWKLSLKFVENTDIVKAIPRQVSSDFG